MLQLLLPLLLRGLCFLAFLASSALLLLRWELGQVRLQLHFISAAVVSTPQPRPKLLHSLEEQEAW
jgi:hypothetical protein